MSVPVLVPSLADVIEENQVPVSTNYPNAAPGGRPAAMPASVLPVPRNT